jgi:AcrR family transcriptional regulator
MVERTSAPRSDAARNRELIMAAASELFAGSTDTPMYEVGKHAGVGQATLYRHFPHRSTLLAAVVEEHVELLEDLIRESVETNSSVSSFLRSLLHSIADRHTMSLVAAGRAEGGDKAFDRLRARVDKALAKYLSTVPPTGLRDDITVADVHLILAMARGALQPVSDLQKRRATVDRILKLLLPSEEPTAPRARKPSTRQRK